jgi:hypothetical protein
MGAGVELPAFAGRVIPDARIGVFRAGELDV